MKLVQEGFRDEIASVTDSESADDTFANAVVMRQLQMPHEEWVGSLVRPNEGARQKRVRIVVHKIPNGLDPVSEPCSLRGNESLLIGALPHHRCNLSISFGNPRLIFRVVRELLHELVGTDGSSTFPRHI